MGLVEKAINLADKLINQRDITCVNSTQEVDLHKITCLTALLITKQKAYLVPNKRVDKSLPSESGIEKWQNSTDHLSPLIKLTMKNINRNSSRTAQYSLLFFYTDRPWKGEVRLACCSESSPITDRDHDQPEGFLATSTNLFANTLLLNWTGLIDDRPICLTNVDLFIYYCYRMPLNCCWQRICYTNTRSYHWGKIKASIAFRTFG